MVQKLLFWLSHLAKSEVRHWKRPRDTRGKGRKKSFLRVQLLLQRL